MISITTSSIMFSWNSCVSIEQTVWVAMCLLQFYPFLR